MLTYKMSTMVRNYAITKYCELIILFKLIRISSWSGKHNGTRFKAICQWTHNGHKKIAKNLGYQEIFQYFATPQSPVLGCYRFNRESGQLYERLCTLIWQPLRSVAVFMRQINGGCSGLKTNMNFVFGTPCTQE